jgi:hypothetical protein
MATKTAKKIAAANYDECAALAAKAQAKAKPASAISPSNIACCQEKLGGRKPSKALGITKATLAQLATGKKRRGDLPEDQRAAFSGLSKALGPQTYYGRKLAGMLWAVEAGGAR